MLAHQILKDKNYGYINFDDERLAGVKANDLNDFLEVFLLLNEKVEYLLFDEIQNVEGWELFVNRLKRQGYNIVVTGSNSKLLSKEMATHLTGRHIAIELFPFSFQEFLIYKNFKYSANDFYLTRKRASIKKLLAEYLKQGGFPELFNVEFKEQYLRDLYGRIASQDIAARHHIKYVNTLKEITLYAMSNFGSRITYHKFKNIFEIKSVHTIKNYLEYLEEAYLIFLISPFSYKLKSRLRGPKKIYAIDTGMINAIAPRNSPDTGKILENLVFLELKRREKEIYFFNDYANNEVDFAIKEGVKIKQLIQVCKTLENYDTKKREIKSLIKAGKELKCNNLFIIAYDEEGEEKVNGKKIKIIPLWKWLLENDKN